MLVRFPFTDLSQTKLRPAVVLADARLGDWILCQITSNPFSDPLAVEIATTDFESGFLRTTSFARPAKLFTASSSLISSGVGILKPGKFEEILDAVVNLLKAGHKP
jgi:PemK-like, MazF-like toxin of type II toxin-antitoxin system